MQEIVVFVRASGITSDVLAAMSASSSLTMYVPSSERSPERGFPVSGSHMLPTALTALRAPTRSSPADSTSSPRPLFMERSGPSSLPTVQPHPAPTLPRASGSSFSSKAAATAWAPSSMPGRTVAEPQARSKRQAEETIGTMPTPTSRPTPLRSSSSAAPEAAARPYAEPPESMTQWRTFTVSSGLRRSVSRVAGAPPRTSTAPVAPFGQTMAVHPVPASASVACPARKPGMSRMDLCMLVSSSEDIFDESCAVRGCHELADDAGERKSHDRVEVAFDMLHEQAPSALDPIGSCLVGRLS